MTQSNANAANNNGEMPPNVPPQEDFDTEALRGSMQQILSQNIGKYVICEFLIGTDVTRQKTGVIYDVGISFLVLHDETRNVYTVCDIFAIKFVTFFDREASAQNAAEARRQTETARELSPSAAQTSPEARAIMAQQNARMQAAFNYAKRKARR